ncbi:hypothetical protein CPB84DRAFT_1768453 [Gymnopilus junonius]|uniref:Uncharacterized protein n=1 Tax=Gymnopilus junonius TaxID=109634 RepID=A0A9P5NV00_GYMJU|nr:hypothetical protein CPB84DRAFT_1768453 [Gymnopilus junonius]
MPAAAPSKASVCSFVTPTCTHLFHGRFSRRGPSGRRSARVKTETLEDDVINIIVSSASASAVNETSQAVDDGPDAVMQEQETGARMGSRVREEVGNGTFIREMYRAPSWILSPPDNLPSPLALVNSNTDTATSVSSTGSPAETELLTPATLVDCPEDYDGDEVTISIPKGLQIELDADLSELARGPDSTLRLVPPVPPEMRFSYDGESRSGGVGHDQSMFSEEESSVVVADA